MNTDDLAFLVCQFFEKLDYYRICSCLWKCVSIRHHPYYSIIYNGAVVAGAGGPVRSSWDYDNPNLTSQRDKSSLYLNTRSLKNG